MELIWDGIREAARLWWQGDAEIIEITLRTLAISGLATLFALAVGHPDGRGAGAAPILGARD